MNSAKRRIEFLHHFAERKDKGRPPPDQYIIMAGAQTIGPGCTLGRSRQSHYLPQSPAHAVAFDGIAYLSRYGESDTHRPFVAALPRLQNEGVCRRPRAAGGGAKIAPPSQPLDGDDGTGAPTTH
jgi:hypothetical protein